MTATPPAGAFSLTLPAVSNANSLDSTTHGPAIKNSGRSRPTSKPQSFMSRDALDLGRLRNPVGLFAPAKVHGCADEGGKQRMTVEGRGSKFGVELAADEPGMVRQFHYLRQVLARCAR